MNQQQADSGAPGALSPSRWRVTRVDKGAIRAIPDDGTQVAFDGVNAHDTPDDAAVPQAAGRTWRTGPEGTLPAVVGEPLAPAVGDWLHVAEGAARIAPRISELVRDSADTTSREQVIAANVDTVLIAEPLEPLPALGRIERLLTIAHRCGARPVVVLTKADVVADADYWVEQVRAVAPTARVLALSATTGAGIDHLRTVLDDASTLVLVGPSGAGKSTLVNTLAGTEVMGTGRLRGDQRGMHTTTHRELVPLGHGQVLIDTPGLRSIGLVATEDAVATTFEDVESIAAGCRFTDCAHDREPGCAVQAAVESGALAERRLDSWRSLRREAQRQAMRADARLGAEQNRQWRRGSKAARQARSRARR
ncbi:ribosome small subunit-dependent GTPase A [Pseudactinotalea sp. Z1748]|uniref:ribosome small subunit-dependent GTPase A n=1 Tax=Pseudactinotalea sp. Z1748 TaxID=3413027 RepID=UPI003C7BD3DF